jgi:intracellular sulfur oxidation DsrE/DsrF family protein
MRKMLACVAMPLMLLATPLAALAVGNAPTKVVIQVSDNDPAKWNLALNNAKNIQNDLGAKNVDIEIVAYGPGIDMLKFDSEVAGRLSDAASNGVTLAACANTMRAHKLTKDDMSPAARIVPSGVVEIIEKEKEGYEYIRP